MQEFIPSRERIAELLAKELKVVEASTPASRAMYERGLKSLPLGVASSYQARDPYPIYARSGVGSKIVTVDGCEMIDFHNAFGCMVQGHAHPVIVEAVEKRMRLGTQFALPCEDSIIVAEHLARHFKLPKWRFVNSGSEATMDAIRIARGFTGRDTVLKIMGSYHGHHDYVMVSVMMYYADLGPRDDYASVPYGTGLPECAVEMTVPVPYNDVAMMEARIERLIEEGRRPACLIMEPAMMNLGVVLPKPGYLEAVRELTRKHGIVLIFDEVKTGITTAAGGAVERFGVVPDMVTLAKAISGGLPAGAVGGTDEIMAVVAPGKVYQVGTYNGNPLCMAAARASLEEVMTPDAYARLDHLNDRLMSGIDAVNGAHGLPYYTVGIRSKGCVTFAADKITDYESYIEYQDHELCKLAWSYAFNRGVLIAGNREAEWTLSIQHSDEDIDRYLAFYGEFIHDVTAA
jgi:glutamate-1-semialdehyde 2,1-aminomutase